MTRKTLWKRDPVPGQGLPSSGEVAVFQCWGRAVGERALKAKAVKFLVVAPHLGKRELVINILIPCESGRDLCN